MKLTWYFLGLKRFLPSFAVFYLVFVVLIRLDWVLLDFRGFDEV